MSNSAERHSVIPAVWMILLNEENQVFLLRRANTGWRDGWYTIPAGHVEVGESPTAAAIRELKEEADVEVESSDLGDPLTYVYPSDDKTNERVSFFFAVKKFAGTPRNAEVDKADEAAWVDINNLPENTVPILRLAIEDVKKGVKYSDRFYEQAHHDTLL